MTMTIERVKVRFRRPFQGYKGGQVIEIPKGQARSLELLGRADIVREPQLEMAVAPGPEVETAVAPVAKAPRRRRAKR